MPRKANKSVWIVSAFLLIVFLFLTTSNLELFENFQAKCDKKYGEGKNLLPVMDPMYNMREFCKQSILLEDHLTHPRKSCADCINKHNLTLEALAEEACTLDKKGKHKDILIPLPEKCRMLQKRLYSGEDPHSIAQEYRKIRKRLMPLCRDSF